MTAKIRLALGILSFVVFLALIAGPILYLVIFWDWITGESGVRHRRRTGTWLSFFAWLTCTWARPIIGIRFYLELPAEFTDNPNQPFLLVTNHQNTLDIYFLNALLGRFRRRHNCWISKKMIRRVPLIGRSAYESGGAFVSRDGDPADQERVRTCGRLAHGDGASVILFAEGTRFRGAKPNSGFERVLPPKIRGFEILREELPDHPILSLTIDWRGLQGQTLFNVKPDSCVILHMRARIIRDLDNLTPAEWIVREWQRKDQELLEMRALDLTVQKPNR